MILFSKVRPIRRVGFHDFQLARVLCLIEPRRERVEFGFELTEAAMRRLIGKAHRLRELLLSGYAEATNPSEQLDTMERSYLYVEFAEQILGLSDWPSMSASKVDVDSRASR